MHQINHKRQNAKGLIASLVTVRFASSCPATLTEDSLHKLLCIQFRYSRKTYVASLEEGCVKILDSATCELVQAINGRADLVWFINSNDILIGHKSIIKIWSIRHSMYTQTMQITLKANNANYIHKDILVVHAGKNIDVLNVSTVGLYSKKLEHDIEHDALEIGNSLPLIITVCFTFGHFLYSLFA